MSESVGLRANIAGNGVSLSDETAKNILSTVGGLVTVVREYWNRSKNEPEENITAMRKIGKNAEVEIEEKNTKNIMYVQPSSSNQNGPSTIAMNHIGEKAKVKQTASNTDSVLVVGYGGEDLQRVSQSVQKLTENNVHVKIFGDDLEQDYDSYLKPTVTVRDIIKELKLKTGKEYCIYRNEAKLDNNLTMAQAERDGSTVNWEARLLR